MKTITVQIGNTDNKLSQYNWSEFVKEMKSLVGYHASSVHFFGGSPSWEVWQNACWVFNMEEGNHMDSVIEIIYGVGRRHDNKVAITIGETVIK